MDYKEIVTGKELRSKLLSGVEKLSSAVVTTLGPFGKTVILTSALDAPYITKDGVSVARKIKLKDPVENVAAELIKEVAEKTLNAVGDGTTTSVALAKEFIYIGFSLIEKGVKYRQIKEDLRKILFTSIKMLEESAVPLDKESIYSVAKISANNDEYIASLIDSAFKHSSLVKVFPGFKHNDEVIISEGMELSTTYVDKAFINVMEKQAIRYNEPFNIIVIDGKLVNLDCIAGLLKNAPSKNFIIVAEEFGDVALGLLKENHNRGALTIVPIKSPGFAQHRKDLLQDIAFYTNAVVIDPFKTYANIISLGQVEKVEVTPEKTFISVNNPDPSRLNELKQYVETLEPGYSKELVEKRIEALAGNVVSIYVGGVSELEMKERYDRVEDAVKAVSAALEEGIVEGGGVALVRVNDKLATTEGINHELAQALMAPSLAIWVNSEGAIGDYRPSMFDLNIIDPLKVTKAALTNAISVATTILGTEAIVLDQTLWG